MQQMSKRPPESDRSPNTDPADASSGSAPARRVTVYDVASAAGTSASTVSRVLNGSGLIADSTRRSVLDAASRLGYTRRRVRRSAERSVLNVVVFLPRAAEPQAHLFYDAAALFAGIQSGFGDVRVHTIAALTGATSPFQGKKLGDLDGCIFAFADPPPAARATLADRGIPAVVINRIVDDLACFVNDYDDGMAGLARLVAERRGPARTAYVSVATANPVARYRRDALLGQRSLAVAGEDVCEFASISLISTESVGRLLDRGYEVRMCANDLVAVAVYERLLRLGVRVPEEVGLTGYDAAPVLGLVSTAITTVDLAGERLGHVAASQLLAAILSRSVPTGRSTIPGELLVGATL